MDIAAISTGIASMETADAVTTAMLANVKDLMNQQGNDLIRLMSTTNVSQIERSVTPHIGGSIDIKV